MNEPTPEQRARLSRTPLVASIASGVGFVAMHRDPWNAFLEGGFAMYLVVVTIAIGGLLAAFGIKRIGGSLGHLLAALGIAMPAVVGWFGHGQATLVVVRALEHVAPSSLDAILAVGFGESLRPLELGYLGTGALAAFAGLTSLRFDPELRVTRLGFLAIAVSGVAAAMIVTRFADAMTFAQTMNQSRVVQSSLRYEAAESIFLARSVLASFAAIAALALVVPRLLVISSRVVTGGSDAAPWGEFVLPALLLALVAGDFVLLEQTTRRLAAVGHRSFTAHLDAFDALRLDDVVSDADDLVVVPGFAMLGDTRVPLEPRALDAALARIRREIPGEPGRTSVAVAFDARVQARVLAQVIAAARRIGATDLELRGIVPLGHFDARGGRVDTFVDQTFARPILPAMGAVRVALARPMLDVEELEEGRVEVDATPRPAPFTNVAALEPPIRFVQLKLRPDATPRSLADAVITAREGRGAAYLVDEFETRAATAEAPPDTTGAGLGLGLGLGSANDSLTDPGILRALALGAATPDAGVTNAAPIRPEDVRRIIVATSSSTRRCYERLLANDPDAAGRIEATFTIGAGGRIVAFEGESDTLPSSMIACLERALRATSFPDPGAAGTMQIRYPFIFSASH